MIKKEYFRYPKITQALEVTKSDLLKLSEKFSYISISEADRNNIKEFNENEIVGAIFGNIDDILQKIDMGVENDVTKNPDCWFVNNEYIKRNYKSLDRTDFKFGEAIELLKLGYKVARESWSSKDMWLILHPATFKVELRDGVYKKAGLDKVTIDAHIDMYTAQGTIQLGWLASQADMLAEDWYIVN